MPRYRRPSPAVRSVPSPRSLRVGLVCPYSLETPGGVQNHVLGLAGHLRERGHAPSVLAPGELPTRLAATLAEDGFASAGTAVPLRYNGSVARVGFGPLTAARARSWLRRGAFDLVHVHEPITPSVALLALWAAETPVVATFHTATPRSRSMQLAGGVLRPALEKLHAQIAVSESARLVVVQHLGRDAVVIPNGFRFADFAATPRPPAPAGHRPRLLFLGRTDEPRKGLDVLLAALPAIRRAAPDLEVVVAGQGARPLPPDCVALGLIDEREKADLLASADVFVAPHRARESFGIVVLEAMASGAPVVASDLAPFAELLGGAGPGPVERGMLFAGGEPADLAQAVVGMLRQPDADRTERARRHARRFDWSVVGRAIESVYRTMLDAAYGDVPAETG